MPKILLVEDDLTFSLILEGFLKNQGYAVEVVHRVKDGIKSLSNQTYQLLLIDYRLPDGTGFEILEAIKAKALPLPVIMMTSFREVGTAVRAMRLGAFDYITKPVNPDELLMVVQEALNKKETPPAAKENKTPLLIQGHSEASKQLYDFISLVAPTEMSVIIQGESGTGKEYAALTIHRQSKRAEAPFVAIDCGAISGELANSELFGHVKGAFTGALSDKQGLFEAAQGGTVFLDEVGNLSYEIQVKLLRALQERVIQPLGSNKQINIDVRVITATNEDLISSVKNGAFREDLYHRLNEFKIKVPALRDRGNDLEEFVRHFTNLANQELGRQVTAFAPEVMAIFQSYHWPGNLRELRNVVRRAVLLTSGATAGKETLPDEMVLAIQETPKPEGPDLKARQEATERELILKTLQEVKYNKSKAARLLNIDRKTLYLKLTKYNIPA
ncbi:sigma-54-dependent Fis family transcriptional regulator [Adhaeribacter aerolatus]|uniref:Sigma-54-dependent Fis family transcriptional regulator n=1 Tax=Adhaeribacter aerolatus TaxID=670289 RepID=A0A512AX19_9BACT|nr:sigma-54 dependent transcriptional regulator [Adhaeribacter aerolatus]GEO04269.1 sigma-54-dependent Fis family transcriptional regulator [Adhaeribacter aerolatus]